MTKNVVPYSGGGGGVAFWALGHVVECVGHLPHSQVRSTLLPSGPSSCKYFQITSAPGSGPVSDLVFSNHV